MKINAQLHLFVLIYFLSACAVKPTRAPNEPSPNPPTVYATSSILPTTIIPTPSLISSSMPTLTRVTQPAFENIKWATYSFDVGVTFEYPSEWSTVIQDTDQVLLSGYASPVRVEVYNRPVEDRAVANPHSWGPNEGGYEVLWEKPISIENADGIEFIWGRSSVRDPDRYLVAIYYSEQYELDVRLKMDIDSIPTAADDFRVFEHMVQSVRMAP